MSNIPVLKKLERKKSGMTLSWSDGFEVVVEYKQLRYWCPCAKCAPKRDSEETAEILTNEISKYKSGIPEVKKVGGYALQFDWPNGCSLSLIHI